jgi:hypothetical protein
MFSHAQWRKEIGYTWRKFESRWNFRVCLVTNNLYCTLHSYRAAEILVVRIWGNNYELHDEVMYRTPNEWGTARFYKSTGMPDYGYVLKTADNQRSYRISLNTANGSQHSDGCPPQPDIGRTASGNRQLVVWRKNVECMPTSCFSYLNVHFTTSSADKPVFKMPWKREEAIWMRVGRQITKYATRRATDGTVWNTDKCYTQANQSYSLKTYDARRRHIRQHAIYFRTLI